MPRKKNSNCSSKDRNRKKSTNEKEKYSNSDDEDKKNLLVMKQSEVLGRYVVARRTLKPGEIILTDEAMVVGPCQESQALCIGCYVNINLRDKTTYRRCGACSWPLCSNLCSGYHSKYGHDKYECDFLSKSLIKGKQIEKFACYYYALTPFRCLILKETNPDMWNLILKMESHTEKRKESTDLWETNAKMAVDMIQKEWGFSQFPETEIHFVCGVLEVNAFEVRVPKSIDGRQQCLRALYPESFLFAHDCVPNACYTNGRHFQMVFRTLTTVPRDEKITISYAYTLQSTLKRRQHLEKTKFFSCICKRCSDPTELSTYAGAIKCQTCKRGHLLPENPLNNNSLWKCNFSKCQTEINASDVDTLLNRLFEKLDSIDGNDIDNYERYLIMCESILHEDHYLCLSAMHCLSRLYGKIEGYMINDLSDELLQRKVFICKRLIRIFEKLQPGLSKEKGILCYELHAPLMILLRRKYENKDILPKEMKCQLKKIIHYLEEAGSILSKEPDCSEEKLLSEAASEALKTLKASY